LWCITKDFYEARLKQYETELNRIEDKLSNIDETDKDFYAAGGYIIQLAKHSNQLFKCSEYEERRLLIKTVLTNVTWNGEKQKDFLICVHCSMILILFLICFYHF